ncbi:hypothetical protein WG908_11215 [Sphingobium sp. AN641]|uniref:hypothetical protein n=1 Tax=Sphingobium sp. AN641 TaxID=3133443 RepID=UPI0030C1227B
MRQTCGPRATPTVHERVTAPQGTGGRYGDAGDARGRALGLALAVMINTLLLFALLTVAPKIWEPKKERRMPVSFTLSDDPKPGKTAAPRQAAPEKTPDAEKPVTPRPVERVPPPETPALPFIVMSREDMASGDIGKLARRGGGASAAGADSAAAYGPGEGPGGERLYDAEWVREPTDAELGPYMPANAPPDGWGLVACKTVERFRVENCQILGEHPLGSGLAKAVRLAAWQFLVRPPRIGGKAQVGEWVRIKIDYKERRVVE